MIRPMIGRATALPALLMLAACGGGGGGDAADPAATATPSVLVSTVRAQQGSLPAIVTAYGSVAPSVMGTQTFSEAQAGQVTQLAVAVGSVVRSGQTLATFVTAPTARSSYSQAVNALDAARKARATIAQLLSQQLATTDQQVQADRAVTDAQTALAALRAEGAGSPVHGIVAPFAGVVTAVTVAQGNRTQPGAAILTVARAGAIVVTVGIDPSQRSSVAAGQPATLTRLSGGGALAGRVMRIDGALNAATRMVDVDLSFPAGMLLPGEAMQVAIETSRVTGWVVPHKAVVTAGGHRRIFQVADGKAKTVSVALRMASQAGDVVDGAYQVADGDAVRRGR